MPGRRAHQRVDRCIEEDLHDQLGMPHTGGSAASSSAAAAIPASARGGLEQGVGAAGHIGRQAAHAANVVGGLNRGEPNRPETTSRGPLNRGDERLTGHQFEGKLRS
ncbi:MAG: hypothetical protein CO108_07085 [Deltaproteobacteria bacterium CG_4_9_14_3_um_filter_63_12]|nr:MAG: hypothetical protein COW42_13635 [Deltaproteobacteria bacterium CG17_big_fil_post_rev_8_21_14_2_50_63_7]PJB45592.1 MAG: hypothetical protein CO108_07085 [Deltaproteobacteria bacterium CG_4_9_14_3_um_filter_63_12]